MKTSYQWADLVLDCVRKYDFDDVKHDPEYTWISLEMDVNRIMGEHEAEVYEEGLMVGESNALERDEADDE
jgi:hypothetical protein